MKKKKKKRLRLSGLIFILLLIYLIGVSIYYVIKLPIKNIKINGLNILTEAEVIELLNLKDSYPMIKLNNGYLKNSFKNTPLIDSFELKKNLKGKVTITIKEAKVLFFYEIDQKVVLSNEKMIEDDDKYLGIPTLINSVPQEVLHNFIINFSKIDSDIISMISEIEYDPEIYEDVVVDNERFVFTMNDKNKVYINTVNMDKMNKYQSVVSKTKETGTLYLDSSGKNFVFKLEGSNENQLQ